MHPLDSIPVCQGQLVKTDNAEGLVSQVDKHQGEVALSGHLHFRDASYIH